MAHICKKLSDLSELLVTLKLATGNLTPILASLVRRLNDVLDLGVTSSRPKIVKTKDKEEKRGYWPKKVCFLTKRAT